MAIQINSSLILDIGVPIEEAYLRIEYTVNSFGNKILYDVFPYTSRNSYIEYKNSDPRYRNSKFFQIDNFKNNHTIEYNKDTNGVDVLQMVHDHLYSYITEDEIYEKKLKDPSTGEYIIDPSTGEIETEDIISREKFALPENVFIVDLDSSTN